MYIQSEALAWSSSPYCSSSSSSNSPSSSSAASLSSSSSSELSLYLKFNPYYRNGSSVTALLNLPLYPFLSEGWFSVRPSAWQSMLITSVQVFFGQPRQRPHADLSFWTFSNQPSLRSTWSCHMGRWVQSTFARSSRCILSDRSCELTWSLAVTPHIQRIIAWSLRFRHSWHTNCKSFLWRRWEMSGRWGWAGARWICPRRQWFFW